ncbi:MAG: PEP-CTERM sorting domain-containing protein [Pseudomonadota bacterium]
MRKLSKIVLSCLALSVSAIAHAATVTFDDTAAYSTGQFTSTGFDFNLTGLSSFISPGSGSCGPACPSSGSQYALAAYGDFQDDVSALVMSKSGGGTFSLNSFQGAGSFDWIPTNNPQYIPSLINVVGNLAGGGTVTQSFAVSKISSGGSLIFSDYTFNSGFSNLLSVKFSSSGSDFEIYNGFSIDNINVGGVSAVPEPEPYAMLLAGLGLVGWMARRRKVVA